MNVAVCYIEEVAAQQLIGQVKRYGATSQDVFECLQIPRGTVLIPNDINFKKGMLSIFKVIT